MKKTTASLLISLASCMSVFAQGSLTPPAAPTPTMKTLSQIESRTVIDPSVTGFATPYNITQPGSYYLAGNISISNGSNAIVIAADNVTLDLNGFSLISTSSPAAGAGISLSGTRTNITIRNGGIHGQVVYSGGSFSGAGFNTGIATTNPPTNTLISDVAVSGCSVSGIVLQAFATTALVERCTVRSVNNLGIYGGNVSNCSCETIGTDAINACQRVTHSYGESLGNGAADGVGISATTVEDSFGYSPTHNGIAATNVSNSFGHCNTGSASGITADTAINSEGISGGGIGLNATYSAENCTGIGATAGISTKAATNCYGSGAPGILAESASGCTGQGFSGNGITTDIATGCKGTSNSGVGLRANFTATNCKGTSSTGNGLEADFTAMSCYGETASATAIGIKTLGTANSSSGRNSASTGSPVAIQAAIGIGCTTFGGSTVIPNKYLGTP